MKYAVAFGVGAVVGAGIAMLVAPRYTERKDFAASVTGGIERGRAKAREIADQVIRIADQVKSEVQRVQEALDTGVRAFDATVRAVDAGVRTFDTNLRAIDGPQKAQSAAD